MSGDKIFLKNVEKRKRTNEDDENVENKKMRSVCPICLVEMTKGIKTTVTPCNHVFCSECLETSVSYSTRCPLCRSLIVPVVDIEWISYSYINLGMRFGRRMFNPWNIRILFDDDSINGGDSDSESPRSIEDTPMSLDGERNDDDDNDVIIDDIDDEDANDDDPNDPDYIPYVD